HDLRVRFNEPSDLLGSVDGYGFDRPSIVTRDVINAGVALVEVRFEDLNLLPGDDRATNAPNQLFALAAEHDATDDLDPATGAGGEIAVRDHSRSRRLDGLREG